VKREQLEHVLRAASRITNDRDILVIGSAAILGTYPDHMLPLEASRSDEADLAPFDDADGGKSMRIEVALGQGSQFHETFGYYADGVDLGTAVTPAGALDRLVPFQSDGTAPGRGLCLDPHDLAASKLAAGRDKDYEFVGALLDAKLLNKETLIERVGALPRNRVLPAFLRRAERWLSTREPQEPAS